MTPDPNFEFPKHPVGSVANLVYYRAKLKAPERFPFEEEILLLVVQLLSSLFSAYCYPTPATALKYVSSQRYWRTMRISRMVRRYLYAINPKCSTRAVESVVEAVLFRCRICTLDQMVALKRTIKNLPGATVGGNPSPEPP